MKTASILLISTWYMSAMAWYKPVVDASWQIQYGGTLLDENWDVEVYDIDGFNASISLIEGMHRKYRRVICYFSAGSWENYVPDAASFPSSVLGNTLDGWPNEKWLDIRQLSVLKPLMMKRAILAQSKGCDGIDWDNVDGFDNKSGFDLQASDQLAYNTMLATITHDLNMAVGLKNDLSQVSELVSLFDFAVNESCQEFDECETLLPFIQAGKPVWAINYDGTSKISNCNLPNQLGFRMLLKDLDLNAAGYACWQTLSESPSFTAQRSITTSPAKKVQVAEKPDTS